MVFIMSKNQLEILYLLIRQQIVLRYRSTVIGYLWTLINPALMITLMTLVFSTMMKRSPLEYSIMLFSGLIPWNFLSQSMGQSCTSIIQAEGVLKKIKISYWIFPVSNVVVNFIDCLLAAAIMGAALTIASHGLDYSILVLPISFALTFFAGIGIGLIMSIVTVIFRDGQYIVSIFLQGAFFITPIFYEKESNGTILSYINMINPLSYYINIFRKPIYYMQFPSILDWSVCTGISLILMLMGIALYKKNKLSLIKRL